MMQAEGAASGDSSPHLALPKSGKSAPLELQWTDNHMRYLRAPTATVTAIAG